MITFDINLMFLFNQPVNRMNIGFDAKRAFHNETGLGHYSRSLINSLAKFFPQYQYFLFTPSRSQRFDQGAFKNMKTILPKEFLQRKFNSFWRSRGIIKDLKKNQINLFHGLSNEIPIGIQNTNILSVVTIHDLIFERFPLQYRKVDTWIYRKKFHYACTNANKIVAVSHQTKKDIINFYKIPEEKIEVVYQSCNPIFSNTISNEERQLVLDKLHLPKVFFLYVGSIIERKNLLGICKALKNLPAEIQVPLVLIGDGKGYKKLVKEYISQNNLASRVIWLSEFPNLNFNDFPAIYQSAIALIYPSLFEGFGIPILEALWSGCPVITSRDSCFEETAGDAAIYIDPNDYLKISKAMWSLLSDSDLRDTLKRRGFIHAQKFTSEKCAGQLMKVYRELLNN